MRIYFDIPDDLEFRSAKLILFARDLTADEFVTACRRKNARIGSFSIRKSSRGWFPALMARWEQAGREVEVFGPDDDRNGPVRASEWRYPVSKS